MKIQFPWRKYQMIQACIDFYNLHLWEQFNNMDLFVAETPVEGPVVAGIMGSGGQEIGLEIFRGPDPFRQAIYVLDSDGNSIDDKIDTLGFSMSSYGDLGYYEKKWFKSCNFRAKNSDQVPIALCKRPKQQAGLIENDRDIRLMLYVLKGLLKAHEEGNFDPRIIDDFKFLTLQISGDEMDPEVKVRRKSYAAAKKLLKYYESIEPLKRPNVSELARLDQTWLVVPIYMDTAGAKFQQCTLCIANERSGSLLCADVIETKIGSVLDMLYKLFMGDNAAEQIGVPVKIIIAERELYLHLREGLEDIGMKVQCLPNHPLAMDIRRDLNAFLSGQSKNGPASVKLSLAASRSVVPAEGDLAGWKRVLSEMMDYFYGFWEDENKLHTVKVSKQFFGDSNGDYYIHEYQSMSLPSYVTWAVLCYRSEKNDCTYAEELLGSNLSDPVRISLEAIYKSWPSLYKIVKADKKAGTLLLDDLLLTQTVTVYDQKLSESAVLNAIAPFWVYRVGHFHFVNCAGPCFGIISISDVIEKLQKLGLPAQLTPDWLRQNAHIFGRLWKLFDDIYLEGPSMPVLTNTDGDLLEFITASFACDNPASAQETLRQRKDMDYGPQEDLYAWFKGKRGVFMKNTLLGRIRFKDNGIEVEVNSYNRLKTIKKILESIPGIYYLRHKSRKPQEAMKKELMKSSDSGQDSRPSDKLLPEELRQAAIEHMRQYYMEWLDMPIPAFGNQTPRQAAKNPKMAQQVRIMIKSMPDVVGNTGAIGVPRKEMLRALGLPE